MVLKELSPPALAFDRLEKPSLRPYRNYLEVCERWRRIYEPFFYYFPNLWETRGRVSYRKTSALLTTLRSRPDLRACVQRLEITINAVEQLCNKQNIVEIIQLCKASLRSALIHGNWQPDYAWALIHALEGHHMHTLKILGPQDGIGIQTLIYYLDFPTLHTLCMRRNYCLDPKCNNTPGLGTFDVSEESRDISKESRGNLVDELTCRAGQASITSLKLRENYTGLTQALIAWPAKLLELELSGICESSIPHLITYSAPEVQAMLEPHRKSLEKLKLGIMTYKSQHGYRFPPFTRFPEPLSNDGYYFLNVARFPKLRRLTISSPNLFDHNPDIAAACLNAPNLSRLDIVFYPVDQFGYSLTTKFGLMHKDWLITFGRKIVANSSLSPVDPSSSSLAPCSSDYDLAGTPSCGLKNSLGLKTIFIQFLPISVEEIRVHFLHGPSEGSESDASRSWPWLHMKDAARTLRPLGLKVMFEPYISDRA